MPASPTPAPSLPRSERRRSPRGPPVPLLTLVPRGLQGVLQDLLLLQPSQPHPAEGDGDAAAAGDRDDRPISRGTTTRVVGEDPRAPPPPPDTTVSVGYHSHPTARRPEASRAGGDDTAPVRPESVVWSVPGDMPGIVWLRIDSDVAVAPAGGGGDDDGPSGESRAMTEDGQRLRREEEVYRRWTGQRGIGPLLVVAGLWTPREDDDDASSGPVDEPATDSLENAARWIRSRLQQTDADGAPMYRLQDAFDTWSVIVQDYWLRARDPFLSDEQRRGLERRLAGREPLRFRLSCLRSGPPDRYAYRRTELLTALAVDLMAPLPGANWIVDLKHYDLEIVLLLRDGGAMAVGLNLRPSQWFDCQSFGAGHRRLPPEVAPPPQGRLTRALRGITRLRPSTAALLLHLAQLRPGDVLLDPCAGVGTLPLESLRVVALGGDLALAADRSAPVAARYRNLARDAARRGARPPSRADLLAWDACWLPLRSGSVDAVVSDLPFGQQCLSAGKLQELLPLLMAEFARVLRCDTGCMVLLCGNRMQVLKALETCNEKSRSDDGSNQHSVWRMPCDGMLPVNIGGLIAWVLVVRRGPRPVNPDERHRNRVRRLTGRREMREKCERGRRLRESAAF